MLHKKLLTYGLIIAAIVGLDLVKFLAFDFPTLVNWRSFAHPAWVLTALVLLLASAKLDSRRLWQALFWVYALVAVAALLNHYLPFSETLTYNCMLFNFAFASLYFVAGNANPSTRAKE